MGLEISLEGIASYSFLNCDLGNNLALSKFLSGYLFWVFQCIGDIFSYFQKWASLWLGMKMECNWWGVMGRDRRAQAEARGNKRRDAKEEGRRLSAETVHSTVNIISSLCVVCFCAGLWSKMHFSLWAQNNKPKSHCSFWECPSLRHLSYYRASLDTLLVLGKGAGSGARLPGFEATPHVFSLWSRDWSAVAASGVVMSGQKHQCS